MKHINGLFFRRKFKFNFFLLLFFLPISSVFASTNPVIFYTDIIAGPNTGGEDNKGCYLSIFGLNFGDNLANVKVEINGIEVTSYKYLGFSLGRPDVQQLSIQVGTGTLPNTSTGPIKVIVNGLASNTDHIFTIREGKIFFISHTGNDSAGIVGDIKNPFRTPNGVWDRADFTAGDFLVIRGDAAYDFGSGQENLLNGYRWINIDKSGTSETYAITTYGYPGENVAVSFTATNQKAIVTLANPRRQYCVFANLTFDLNNTGAIPIQLGWYSTPTDALDFARLVNLKVTEGMVGYMGVNPISLQHVDYLKMYGISVGNQSASAQSDLQSHMIYLSHEFNNADIGWCYIHDNKYGRGAFKVAGDGAQSIMNMNVRIHHNSFQNLPQEAISFGEGAKECFFYNNIINNANTNKVSGFSPLSIRGVEENVGDYYVYNNTIYSAAEDGYPGGIIQFGFSPSGQYPHSVSLYNNIIYAINPTTNYYQINHPSFTTDKITADNNIWFGSSDPMPSWAGANSKNVDPLFVDKNGGNFNLLTASPARNNGNNAPSIQSLVTTDYYSNERNIIDIGSVEFYIAAPQIFSITIR
ncbi:MAG: hypothetical protein A2504_09445 [Bdellovibrionales bacterium RIFOXYD12_FULL_39_22]|nr:MAG: hypothetical protein A2385_12935 [Bdellovibrionales bacterium RIFOXYB1_FULL_39_21]OFZ40950.1 MAG: hypothetical protein A2485_16445 [Bdellovibrionales bacterium RIFOXYC12_FULL_39_17]OFZ44778.1 MAG: hypothetical protein A2404_09735 [Bdellovibrionales bacterium RIFOXYC1_FULL_39_130]OFZ74243.1 MAG: hypothetical protein A2560_16700 [Bdellovibrionales bacterium RIFOXYD1_FULL_39_84]OFZ92107.1 MAG: hypothetical protein A2504_09445 [Bdellovibrionales bacterium RIFOXYD12_FULL_39_22]HLE12789.1 hy